jgi:predicted dehydrogenase
VIPLVRIGILGAASIARNALLRPAAEVDGVEVAAVAARDPERGAAFARKHGIGLHQTYEGLLRDPSIDAVYIPLPAALHAEWTIAAVEAGKHVLCEKPFTANAPAAARVVAATAAAPVVVMEAYHSHYHPMRVRLREIIDSGELGDIRMATATFDVPIPPGRDIRWNFALGGGALLDVGYYPLRLLRELLGEVSVTRARAWARGDIDARMQADLEHLGGVRSQMRSSIWSRRVFSARLDVVGTAGSMRVRSPYHPHQGGAVWIRGRDGRRVERPDRKSTYAFQLEAFRDAVRRGTPTPTGPAEALAQQVAIDGIYRAAGLPVRPDATDPPLESSGR